MVMTGVMVQTPLLLDQFRESATNAVATVQVIDRSPADLRDAILQAVGDAPRILYAPPNDLPAALFSDFAKDPRVVVDATPEEMVRTAAGVASTGSVCINVSHERTGMVSLLTPR